MGLGNFRNHRITQQLSRMSSATQRIPSLHYNAQLLNKWDDIVLLIVGMNFILDKRWYNIHLRQKLCQFFYIPVRQPDGMNFPILHKLFYCLIC